MEVHDPSDLFFVNPFHIYKNLTVDEQKKNDTIIVSIFLIELALILIIYMGILYFKNKKKDIAERNTEIIENEETDNEQKEGKEDIKEEEEIKEEKEDSRIKKIEEMIEQYETNNNRKVAFVFDSEIYDNLKVNFNEKNIYKYIIRIDEVGDFYKVLSKDDRNIDLVFHAFGGSVDASDTCSKIIHSIKEFKEVRAIVPFFAKSAATFLVLSCHKIIMSPYAVLGNTDPQIEWEVAEETGNTFSYTDFKFVFDFIEGKNIEGQHMKKGNIPEVDSVDPYFLALAKNTQRDYKENIYLMEKFIQGKTEKKEQEKNIVQTLGAGKVPHSRSYSREDLIGMGLKVNKEFPNEINDILQLIVET